MKTGKHTDHQPNPPGGAGMSRRQFLARGSAFAFAAAVTGPGLTLLSGCGGGGASSATVKIGWVPVLQWTHWADVSNRLQQGDVKAEMNRFDTTNDVLVALTSDSLDMATIGYNHLAGTLADREVPLTFVAGVSSGGSRFVMGKGVNIEGWEDLQGKRLGGARGSTQYIQLYAAMKKHGLDLNKDTKFTNLGGGTDMNVALQNDNVDMIMSWEADASLALVEGYGLSPSAIQNSLYDDSFKVSSGIAARDAFIEENPEQLQTVLKAYYASWEKVTSDRQYWLNAFGKFTDFGDKVLARAAENAFPNYGMDQQDIETMSSVLYEQGIVKRDVTADLLGHMNYEHAAKASGQSASDLGKRA